MGLALRCRQKSCGGRLQLVQGLPVEVFCGGGEQQREVRLVMRRQAAVW